MHLRFLRSSFPWVACLLALVALTSCDSGSSSDPKVGVRFVHLSPDLAAVDIYNQASGNLLFAGLVYNGSTDRARLSSGTYRFDVRLTGTSATSTPIFTSQAVTVSADQPTVTNIFAGLRTPTGGGNALRMLSLVDGFDPNAFPLARVRFVHASADAPAVAIDIDNDGVPEIDGLERFASTDEAGSNLPVVDLDVALLSGDPLTRLNAFAVTGLNRDDQYYVIATGLASAPTNSDTGLGLTVLGRDGVVGVVRPNPQVYFLHAVGDGTSVAVTLDGSTIVDPINYRGLEGPFQVAPGTYTVDFIDKATDTSIVSGATPDLTPGTKYLLAAAGSFTAGGNTPVFIALTDGFTIDPLSANVSFVQATTDIAGGIDFGFIELGSIAQPPLFGDIAYGTGSGSSGEELAAGVSTFGTAETGVPTPVETFTLTTTEDLRAFWVLSGALNPLVGARNEEVFVITTNTDPWTITVVPSN